MVRIWAVPVGELDRQHLLGEHAELHCIVGSLQGKYAAYRHHPETLRFEDRIEQLFDRHSQQVAEMHKRGYNHNSSILGSAQPYPIPRQSTGETTKNSKSAKQDNHKQVV